MRKKRHYLWLLAGLIWIVLNGAHNAQAANWTLDSAKSRISFSGTETGQGFTGAFSEFSATIDFDPAAPASGHANIVIKTCSAHSGDTQRDEAMPGADWFNCAVIPEAIFDTAGFKYLGGDNYQAAGTLTIRGITKPVTLPFTFVAKGNVATVQGVVTLVRTDFGVGQGVWSDGQWVGIDVTVAINLTARKT